MTKFVVFGEMLLRLSPPGRERLFQSPDLKSNFVGAEANVGVTLCRLGNAADMVTGLPDNPVGLACRDTLRAQGLSTDHICYGPGRMAIYYLAPGAMMRASQITYDRDNSAFTQFRPDVYDWDKILERADWLHICGITLAVSPHTAQAALEAITAAKAKGVKVSFDCNYRAALWEGREEESRKTILRTIKHADIVFGNCRDAALLFGVEGPKGDVDADFTRAGNAFFKNCPDLKYLLSTKRELVSSDHNTIQGLLFDGKAVMRTKVYNLNGIVDRIGTGDAFAGGALHGLGQGFSAKDVLDWGLASCMLKHATPGDFNLTSAGEIEMLLSGHGLDVKR